MVSTCTFAFSFILTVCIILHLLRDRTRGAKERICLLEITGDFYSDLKRMRRGVTTESTETARKRLFVNLDW